MPNQLIVVRRTVGIRLQALATLVFRAGTVFLTFIPLLLVCLAPVAFLTWYLAPPEWQLALEDLIWPLHENYYEGVELRSDAQFVSSRRWDKEGLQWLSQKGGSVALQGDAPRPAFYHKKFVIFLHGYSSPQSSIVSTFSELLNYFGDEPDTDRGIFVYDWTSVEPNRAAAENRKESRIDARWARKLAAAGNSHTIELDARSNWELARYRLDQEYARTSGAAGLADLLHTIETNTTEKSIYVIAHSMGCLVVLETIRQHRKAFSFVREVILLAPDVSRKVFEDRELTVGISSIPRIDVFFSRNDLALRGSAIMNWGGRLGAAAPSGGWQMPDNVVVHDVTDLLGELGVAVHSRYLTKEGAELLKLKDVLR